jgi:hypothetical protein
MIALKLLFMVTGVLLPATALAISMYSLWLRVRIACRKTAGEIDKSDPEIVAWSGSVALVFAACLPLLIEPSIIVVAPSLETI